jgi:hypothetical protein
MGSTVQDSDGDVGELMAERGKKQLNAEEREEWTGE